MDRTEEKNSKITKIVELVNNSEISSIKQTVVHILNIINDPNSSAKDLGKIIEIDPPLSAKLLKLANSAFYGFLKRISDIKEAIICIGFDAVKELSLSQKVCQLFEKHDTFNGYSRISLWKHSISVALCSKLISKRKFEEGGEYVYAAGLLHDIGIIVLDQFLHHDFTNILRKMKTEKNNLFNIENTELGFNHMDIGRAITKDWNLPEELYESIGNHHNPDNVDDKFKKIVSIIFISEYITQSKNIGYDETPYKNETQFQNCLRRLKIKEKEVELIIDEVQEEISKMEKAGWF